MRTKRAVVITGVSSGIGLAAAEALTGAGFHVFGTVRQEADATRISDSLGPLFSPLILDVTDADALQNAATEVSNFLEGQTLFGLVNNAGVALGGPLIHQSADQFRAHLDVNIMGVFNSVQAFAPLLGADRTRTQSPGRIINIGSVGGRHAFPFMAAYHTTKYGLEGLTESLRRELLVFGIDAILVAPGSVASSIWEKADKADYSAYANTAYASSVKTMVKAASAMGEKGLPPKVLGQAILKALTTRWPKPYYRVTPSPLEFFMLTKFPKRLIDRIVAKRLGVI
jgi:NAD(P)-dependent dehydrogenase (short-subunit alcohol dehydrogenase family)